MKIKITKRVPVEENVRPKIGEVYNVLHSKKYDCKKVYFINANESVLGVLSDECEVIED